MSAASMVPGDQAKHSKPPASLSIDLDNKWAYLRAAGRSDWETCSSYLPMAIQRVVEILGECELPLTVFLVGRDLKSETDAKAILSFASLPSWEPANHSLNHLPWMHTLDESETSHEIRATHETIQSLTGQRPFGFRGPGFSCSEQVLSVLSDLEYLYDASVFPTSIAPLARAVFLARTQLKGEEKEKAKQLYGGFASMRKPNRPYLLDEQGTSLHEIPVTVMPLLRTPIHFSYLNFIAQTSTTVAKSYFRLALAACQLTGVTPSLLLHPPDFMGCDDDSDMAYFPGMKASRTKKLEFMKWALKLYASQFQVGTMREQTHQFDLPNRDRLGSQSASLAIPIDNSIPVST